MKRIYPTLFSILLIILFITASAYIYPAAMPLAFLTSTFLVALNTLLAGARLGLVTYVASLFVLSLNQGIPPPTLEDLLTRVGIFSFASLVLGLIIVNTKKTEAEAIHQQEQMKVVSDSLSEVLVTIDDESIITFVNPSIESVFGYTIDEVVGKKLTMLMPERFRERHLRGINRYIRTNKKKLDWKAAESVGLHKNGTEFPIEISFGEFKTSEGRAFSAIIRDISIRKNYQLKLNELASIVESSDDAIISKDLDGIIKTWNRGAEAIFGWTEKEMIGQSILKIFPEGEEGKREEAKILETLRRGEKIAHYETVRRRKDGQLVDVSLTVSPIKGADGKVTAVSKIVRDITYRKKQENDALKAAERYKAFIENSDEAIWMVEYRPPVDISLPLDEQMKQILNNGYITEANDIMAKLYKQESVESVIGKNAVELTSSSTTTGAENFLDIFIKNNYSISNWESSTIGEDGKPRFGSTSYKGIIVDGKLVRGWVAQRETTERRLQEQELEQSKERYKTFIEKSDDAIWRTEFLRPIPINLPAQEQIDRFFKQGYIAEANEACAFVLNAPNIGILLNKPLESVGQRSNGDDKFMLDFIKNDYVLTDYESSEVRDGKIIYYSSSVKGIIEGDNWVRAWVVRRNITEQKQYEVERERLLKESEKIRQDLEIASSEKDRFLANLSHELRTPLVAILGYSAMLMESEPDKEAITTMVTTINKNAKLQVQLIEDLLDLSRIISGKIELKKDFFNAGEVVNDAVATMMHQITEKGLKINTKAEECTFYGDKKRFSQIVLNLLSNAIKFTEKGEINICVKCSQDFLTFKVTDTGIGIAPKDFDKLFQPFKQLDSSDTRAKQGLGLGLSIVKNLVDLHGGKVDVASKLGEGSEFKVYLPVIQPPQIVVTETKPPVSADFTGVKLLLVEDDIDGAGFIKYLYEQKGGKVDWVESAKKARECIAHNKYDIYVFDLSMPEEDGISLIRSIRKTGDNTKAVALTAFVDSYYENKALEGGFDMFLKKPSSLTDLLSIIKLIR